MNNKKISGIYIVFLQKTAKGYYGKMKTNVSHDAIGNIFEFIRLGGGYTLSGLQRIAALVCAKTANKLTSL